MDLILLFEQLSTVKGEQKLICLETITYYLITHNFEKSKETIVSYMTMLELQRHLITEYNKKCCPKEFNEMMKRIHTIRSFFEHGYYKYGNKTVKLPEDIEITTDMLYGRNIY